jgi:pyrroloquinoline quinone biosynthesis protein D
MDLKSIPKLAPGCRLHPSEPILLVPEGTLNLAGPAHDVLAQVDGKRSVTEIVERLLLEYSGAPREKMLEDTLGLLQRMEERGVVKTQV